LTSVPAVALAKPRSTPGFMLEPVSQVANPAWRTRISFYIL
jgi:hypothetical protein